MKGNYHVQFLWSGWPQGAWLAGAFMEGGLSMLDNTHPILSPQPSLRVGLLCALILIVVGIIDHLTGYEIAFSLFYLAPVGIAAWRLS